MITRWWPPIGLVAMLLLGWAVGQGPTAADTWFQQLGSDMGPSRTAFLVFTYPPAVTLVLVAVIVVTLRRRQWWLAVAMLLSTPLATLAVQVCKRIFGREKGGALCYPSGHTTFAVVVLGLLVVAAGIAVWSLIVAITLGLLAMFGQAITYHYFTDTIGAALLATSVVCVVALVARREVQAASAARLT
ncbi:PA-phosphatase [Mycobacterium aquaticum]|uniref:PA-phosphatase n=1 Tax=Mycobacterium aquaticum TaxID=1927124 RepID=A0A1X0AI97_9MYCO|nr:PA-phosphatase [Mycobacterium aquaticum]ORA29793.1 PA-phosphatase [Mycobacterium aquaticum]